MAVTLIASPPQYRPFSYRHCSTHEASRFRSPPSLIGHRAPPRLSFSLYSSSSSSSSSPVVEEALPPPPPDSAPLELESAAGEREAASSLRGCKACGREEIERGCNGEGRIQGGIATVPGFGWWPIKAYRPCPGFVASGGRYRRQGQSMDEVAFGRGERGGSVSVNESESSKKGQR